MGGLGGVESMALSIRLEKAICDKNIVEWIRCGLKQFDQWYRVDCRGLINVIMMMLVS
jgi:hypothetical protein